MSQPISALIKNNGDKIFSSVSAPSKKVISGILVFSLKREFNGKYESFSVLKKYFDVVTL